MSGKQGTIYVIDRDNMGRFNPNSDNDIQEIDNAMPEGSFDTPAYFNGVVYYGGAGRSPPGVPAYQWLAVDLADFPVCEHFCHPRHNTKRLRQRHG